MQTDPSAIQRVQDYHDVARRWGYRYRRFEYAPGIADRADPTVFSTGWLDTREPQPGLIVTRSDVTFAGDVEAEAEMQPGLLIAVAVTGPVEGWLEGAGSLSLQPQNAIAIRFDRALGFGSRRQPGGDQRRTLSVFASPDWLAARGLEQVLDRRSGPRANGALRCWLPSLRVQDLIEEAMYPNQAGALGSLMIEALALELLVSGVRRLASEDQGGTNLRPADYARMLRVRDILLAAPEADHSLAGLAAEVGVSVSVLTDHFSRAFGQPVFGFLRDLRLDRARRGLSEEGWTVTQAAYWAGFRHPTNFAAAFRRRYGASPRTFRR